MCRTHSNHGLGELLVQALGCGTREPDGGSRIVENRIRLNPIWYAAIGACSMSDMQIDR